MILVVGWDRWLGPAMTDELSNAVVWSPLPTGQVPASWQVVVTNDVGSVESDFVPTKVILFPAAFNKGPGFGWEHEVLAPLRSVYATFHRFVEKWKAQGGASVVVVADFPGGFGDGDDPYIGQRDAALASMVRGLAMECGRSNIRVNGVGYSPEPGGKDGETTFMKRSPKPQEVLGSILSFHEQRNAYLTGQWVWPAGGADLGRWRV